MNELNKIYLDKHKIWEDSLNGNSVALLKQYSKNASEIFEVSNFPTVKDEEWRFTNLASFYKTDLTPASKENKVANSVIEKINQIRLQETDTYKLFFENGFFRADLSSIENLPNGIILSNLNNAAKENSEILEKYFNKSKEEKNALELLNNLYAVDGLFLFVPKNITLDKPIEVFNLLGDSKNSLLVSTHNLIIIEENAEAKVIFQSASENTSVFYHNYFTEVFAAESSRTEIYDLQEEENANKIGTTEAIIKEKSLFNHFSFNLSGKLIRNNLNAKLDGENIEAHYYGLYTGKEKEHVDNHTFINHAKPNCFSNEVYKGILKDNAKAVFSGKILVEKDAQKTNAYQSNKTILLSDDARIDTKPQLEIYADDVKCTHGATVGQLDKESLYYIISRGIPRDIAQSMLIRAFLADVIDAIKIPELHDEVNHRVFKALNQREI